MKKAIILLMLGIFTALFLSGCYVYTSDPIPPPVIIVPQQGTQPQQQKKSEPPPAPVGAPAGEVGPPKS